MKISEKRLKAVRWTARIFGLAILLFALPFYFGYGNPLPFANSENTLFDNVWLIVFPLVFLGLGLGWKWEKVGGWLIVGSILIGGIASVFLVKEFIPGPMYFPLVIGGLYLFLGYWKK